MQVQIEYDWPVTWIHDAKSTQTSFVVQFWPFNKYETLWINVKCVFLIIFFVNLNIPHADLEVE